MANVYTLSEDDVRILKVIVDRELGRVVNTRGRDPIVEDSKGAPSEVYIAKTPEDGIPGLYNPPGTGSGSGDFDIPGSALCDIYRIYGSNQTAEIRTTLVAQKRVYNLSRTPVPGNAIITITREKYGKWLVINGDEAESDPDDIPLDQPGGGPCELARLKDADCLLASGPMNSVDLKPTGLGYWSSIDQIFYCRGLSSGIVEFWYDSGRVHLSVGGLELLDCGNGCFTGGPLTSHDCPGTDTTAICEGEVFTVCVACQCCSIRGWAGPGWYCVEVATSTSTGTNAAHCDPLYLTEDDRCDTSITICFGPFVSEAAAQAVCSGVAGISTACCPSNNINSTLTLTFNGCTGIYAGLNGTTRPITYDSANGYWRTGVIDFGAVCGNCDIGNSTGEIIMRCDPDNVVRGYIKVDEACTPALDFPASGPTSSNCAAQTFTGFTFVNFCTGIAGTIGWNIAP